MNLLFYIREDERGCAFKFSFNKQKFLKSIYFIFNTNSYKYR